MTFNKHYLIAFKFDISKHLVFETEAKETKKPEIVKS